MPEAFVRKMVRARKEHRCCECGNIIQKGWLYERISGIWDGRPSRFKTCIYCMCIRKSMTGKESFPEDEPSFGELYEYLEGQ